VPKPLPPPGTPSPFAAGAMATAAGAAAGGDGGRLLLTMLLMLSGIGLAIAGGWADVALHRGVEVGVGPETPRHTIGRDLATNVDLTQFEPAALREVASSLQQNGFRYVRQSFAWSGIEPAPGDFRWERTDAIIEALTAHQIVPVAVLHRSPAWARPPDQAGAFDAPPTDVRLFARFVAGFTARYGERVPYVQLWDAPNRSDRWGDQVPSAATYLSLLGAGSTGARGGDPTTTVVLAELATDWDGAAVDDLAFLRSIYVGGGASLFDVVAARADGGTRAPFDRRIDATGQSLSRLVLFREAMIEADDAATPVWATHYGWSADAEVGLSSSRQASFVIGGLERTRAEWPWLGPLFAWGLRPGPTVDGDVAASYALLGANNLPTPQLTALTTAAKSGLDTIAATGFLPVDARQIEYTAGDWEAQHLGPDAYRTTKEPGSALAVAFEGTGIWARLRLGPAVGAVEATLDGQQIPVVLRSSQAQDADVEIAVGLAPGPHQLTLRLLDEGDLTLGGFFIEREVPLQWPVTLTVGSGLALLFVAIRLGISLVAERTGRLQRRRGIELWPELPPMPGWQPSRRA